MGGYSAIGLVYPKNNVNVAATLRAAHCYGSSLVVVQGKRYKRHGADTNKSYRKIPLIHTYDLFETIPFDCIPVSVDIVPGATPLHEFKHPERALYIFGPEDGTLGRQHIEKSKHVIFVQTNFCMNLAATVNVVLYDRAVKRGFPNT